MHLWKQLLICLYPGSSTMMPETIPLAFQPRTNWRAAPNNAMGHLETTHDVRLMSHVICTLCEPLSLCLCHILQSFWIDNFEPTVGNLEEAPPAKIADDPVDMDGGQTRGIRDVGLA
jgi:hypothetical protein